MTEEINYPIKFEPILKEKIWGGNKLISKLNKKSTSNQVGESWELSGLKDDNSRVTNGFLKGKSITELIEVYKQDFLGTQNFKNFGAKFPLLFKFIDAKEDLSIQLHPNDELAKIKHDSFGKTEMWYVIDSERDNAKIYNGFAKKVDQKSYTDSVNSGNVLDLINVDKVKEGDVFFIKAGTIHAIGKGVLLAEIQQTSDVTYRIYDWDRVDKHGCSRELHNDLAVEALDFSRIGSCKLNFNENKVVASIINSQYFTTNKINVTEEFERKVDEIDSFVVYMCVNGEGIVTVNGKKEVLKKGETILVPAIVRVLQFKPKKDKLTLLEVYV